MVITHNRPDSESNLIRTVPLILRRRARISMVRYFTRAPSYVYQIIPRAPRTFIKIAGARSYILSLFTRGAHTPPLFPTCAHPHHPLNSHARPPASEISARAHPRVKFSRPPFPCGDFIFRAPPVSIYFVYSPRVITPLQSSFVLLNPLSPPWDRT